MFMPIQIMNPGEGHAFPSEIFAPKVSRDLPVRSVMETPIPGKPQWDPMRRTWYTINGNGKRVRAQITKSNDGSQIGFPIGQSGTGPIQASMPPGTAPTPTKKTPKGGSSGGADGTKKKSAVDSVNPKGETEEGNEPSKEHGGIDSIQDIFSNDYKPPETILTAIRKISKGGSSSNSKESADGRKEPTIDPLKVTQSCNYVLHDNIKNKYLDPTYYTDMTIEEAKTVASYTYNGDNDKELSPFKEINTILRGGDPPEIKESIDMIYMLLKSIRKIPLEEHPILYRGVKGELVENKLKGSFGFFQPEIEYEVGNIVVFKELTSTSTLRSPAMGFLNHDEMSGVIFRIHNGRGYDVGPFSKFPDEREILMDIESKFKVTNITKEEKWNKTEIAKVEEKVDVRRKEDQDGQGGSDEQGKPEEPKIYTVTVIDLEYMKGDKLPLQEKIEEMKKKEKALNNEKETTHKIPHVSAYKESKAPHAEFSPGDELITRSTSSGRAIELNMRTGEIKDVGSTVGLPKGWVELTEDVEGVEGVKITYYTDGTRKQYERPQTEAYKY